MKILHTGDLHLGSAFSGLSHGESERRRAAQLDNFCAIVDLAAIESVDLVLIAGDLFDTPRVPRAVSDLVFDALAGLSCPVVIAPGNHDPYRAESTYDSEIFPENVFVFASEELERFSFPNIGGGVDVFGYAFLGSDLAASPLESAPDRACLGEGLSILLAHGDLDLPLSKYGPIRSSDLARCGADYVALGHVHNVSDGVRFFGDSAVAYCGFPDGRSFDERGFGSVLILTFDEGESFAHPLVEARRVQTSSHRYEESRVDLSGADLDATAAECIRTFLEKEGFGKETSLRLSLEGEVCLGYAPNLAAIRANLEDSLGDRLPDPLLLLDRTLPIFDAAYLESDPTIRGAVYRTLKPKMLTGTPEERADAANALRVALAALDGRGVL